MMRDLMNGFKNAMISNGITPPKEIIPDGKIHRFKISGRNNGWYILHLDGVPAGAFGDWRSGVSATWCAKKMDQMSIPERNEYQKRIEAASREREVVKAQEQREAAKRAQSIWDASEPVDLKHPYLLKKRIPPYLARQRGSSLVLPVVDFESHIWSLQFIDPNGGKILLKNGAKKRRFIPINWFLGESIIICEGFATGVTLAQAYSGKFVIAAIDAGNLEDVAIDARKLWPDVEIWVCADDDRLTPGNPGMTKARKAAFAAEAKLMVPRWPHGVPALLSDVNDLACWISDNWGRYEE